MSNNNIFTTTGKISAYGFACGYIDKKTVNGYTIEMYMEHSHYHVRRLYTLTNGSDRVWETYTSEELGKARKRYATLIMEAYKLVEPQRFTTCNPMKALNRELERYLSLKKMQR